MKGKIFEILSWFIAIWSAKVFLSSLPYKFSGHPDTQHIFGTIGNWMQGVFGKQFGQLFSDYGAYGVGTMELLTATILLFPAIVFLFRKTSWGKNMPSRNFFHGVGGIMAGGVMSGAVFFHLFTPLGIEVLHDGKSDHGSLFYAAVSILILGFILGATNIWQWRAKNRQPGSLSNGMGTGVFTHQGNR